MNSLIAVAISGDVSGAIAGLGVFRGLPPSYPVSHAANAPNLSQYPHAIGLDGRQ